MNIHETLMDALKSYDNNRERSLQTEIGVSQLGGCRTQVWLQRNKALGGNPTLRLPSLMGTAIHTLIETALSSYSLGAFQLETAVEFEGLPGHIDWYIPESGSVVDWKTTKLKNMAYFPSTQQRWQVHTYGYLLAQNGHEVKTVTLVAIPRDGTENDIVVHTEDYDESVALEALAWRDDVLSRKEAPAPEKDPVQFCKNYCQYFSVSCDGKQYSKSGDEITDPVAILAAKDYIDLDLSIKALETQKDAARTALENVNGITPDGISVGWSSVAGRKTIDEQAVLASMGEVPRKQGEPTMRLVVKK